MGITVLDETAFTTSVWSGGKTTEMYMYPQTASYRDRNFLFRISSATVEEKLPFLPDCRAFTGKFFC